MPGAFLHDERVRDAAALTTVTSTAAGMPVANLRDPQPRLRARFTGGAASVLVDFGTAKPVEAEALISTNLSTNATARRRLGTQATPDAAHDTGMADATEADAALDKIGSTIRDAPLNRPTPHPTLLRPQRTWSLASSQSRRQDHARCRMHEHSRVSDWRSRSARACSHASWIATCRRAPG